MNNFVLTLLLAAATALVWANRHWTTLVQRSQVRALSHKVSACESALQAEQAASTALQQRLQELTRSTREVQIELTRASAEARDLISSGDVASDGSWPAARDYFYLPKQYLGSLGYQVFRNDGTLTDEAAQLFGLTPAEKVQLTDLWRQLRLELEHQQLDKAQRLDPPQADSDDHLEVAFRLPALTNEVAQLKQQFTQDLQTQLGATRGKLIWDKASGENLLSGYPMGDEDRIITFTADRQPDGSVQHTLHFTNPPHNRAYQFGIQFNLQPNQAFTTSEDDGSQSVAVGVSLPLSPNSGLWNYRHLFGAQPLLLPRKQGG
jgi:hypothetical protein